MVDDAGHESALKRQRHNAFTLAPRRAADLVPLVDLWVASWQAVMPKIDFVARRDWFRAHVDEIELRGGTTLCAFDAEDRLAGFILLDADRAYLDQIAVHPRQFGSGLAVRLLNEAKARHREGLTLDVNVDNPRALRFYAREGFTRIGAGVSALSGLATSKLAWP
jgi:putative acetyltransferase